MTTVNDLHPKAMDLAETAFLYRNKGEIETAKDLFLQALVLEQEAASLLPAVRESEPSRSVLYRSAASLAYNAGDHDTADRLVAHALSGFPPPEVKEELKNLYDEINFRRHLEAKGIELTDDRWLMSLVGNATSYGRTLVDQLMLRMETVTVIFYRTVERLLGQDYRLNGGVDRSIKEKYGVYVSAFHARSFAVEFQMGRPEPQLPLFPEATAEKAIHPSSVIDEVMSCFEILEGSEPQKLKERFDDENYYSNFVALAKQIAPDGDAIKLVGFNHIVNGQEKPVALRKNREQLRTTIEPTEFIGPSDRKRIRPVSLQGILTYANTPRAKRVARKGKAQKYGTVKLTVPETGAIHRIEVPIALMKDVVQPYYEEQVIVNGFERAGRVYLEEVLPTS
jgi:tetratricopeptide (TPR) repeat protein